MEPANRYTRDESALAGTWPYPAVSRAAPSVEPLPYPGGAPGNDAPPMPEVGSHHIQPSRWSNAARELIETILLTLVIFFMIRFAIENYRIEGFSMEPNFHDGQFLLVSKLNYVVTEPERGDVIIFRYPQNPKKNFIKRVIGLPGEKVQIRAGKVFVNNVRIPEPYPYNLADYDWGPVTVGRDEYFVLGDNRPESSDSHSWGMLPRKNIIGKAWVSYWPPQDWGIVQDYSYAAAP